MGDCRYCGKPAGFLRREHNEYAERHARAQRAIRDLCVTAALHGGDLGALPFMIREAAAGAAIEIGPGELSRLLAEEWCNAVETAMEDHALSTGEKRGLVRYRARFDLDATQTRPTRSRPAPALRYERRIGSDGTGALSAWAPTPNSRVRPITPPMMPARANAAA